MPLTRELLDIMGDEMTVGDGCWQWSSLRVDGYGRIRYQKKDQLAHRVVYELLVGPIPEDLTLDHLCRNRGCVRPAHLEPVTRGENVLRGESLPAKNARKTHCIRGHLLIEENLEPNRSSWKRADRRCRLCRLEYQAEYREQKRRERRRAT